VHGDGLEAISILLRSCSEELGKLQYLLFPLYNLVVNWVFTALGLCLPEQTINIDVLFCKVKGVMALSFQI